MNDKLTHYYQQELDFIIKISDAYASEHPKIASRLKNKTNDPHISRLIEAAALANARMRYKLAENFNETSHAQLQMLNPQALSPIPSMAIVQFKAERTNFSQPQLIPANTLLYSKKINGHICTFSTRYEVNLLPIIIKDAIFFEETTDSSILKLVISPLVDLSHITINQLRFFIRAQPNYAKELYALLFNHAVNIRINNTILKKDHIQPVGFSSSEGMLPNHHLNFSNYHLLSEFFSFPEKFMFFDLLNLGNTIKNKNSSELEIYIHFNKPSHILTKNLNASHFALNCAPIINLFEKKSEPILWDRTKSSYPVVIEVNSKNKDLEIYSVKRVFSITKDQAVEIQPFYDTREAKDAFYYHASRRPRSNYSINGSDISLSFSDLHHLIRDAIQQQTIYAELSCSDGNLPSQLPFGGDHFGLRLGSTIPGCVETALLLTPITPCRRPALDSIEYWRHFSHLSLNHLSLIHHQGIDALKTLLKMYDLQNSDGHHNLLEGLISITAKECFIPNPQTVYGGSLLLRCIEIILTIAESKFGDVNLYLFGSILNYFFMRYSNINVFTRLTIRNSQSEIFKFSSKIS